MHYMESLVDSDVETMCFDYRVLSHTAAPCAVEPHRRRVTCVDDRFSGRVQFLERVAGNVRDATDNDDFAIIPKVRTVCKTARTHNAGRPPVADVHVLAIEDDSGEADDDEDDTSSGGGDDGGESGSEASSEDTFIVDYKLSRSTDCDFLFSSLLYLYL